MWRQVRESNPSHSGGRWVLSPLRHPCSPIEWGWVGYEEFCRSRRVLSTEAKGRGGKPHEICRILHILRKPNSIIALLFSQNISPFLKEFRHFALCFSTHQNNTTLSPGFLGQRLNNLQGATLLTSFWRQQFNNFQRAALLTPLVQCLANSSWLGWIMRAVLTNQKRRNVFNE